MEFPANQTDRNLSLDELSDIVENRARYLVGICLLIICCVGTVANLAVLCCAWKIFRTVKHTMSGNFLYQYFVVSMTLADLGYVSVYAFGMFVQYSLNTTFNVFTCGFVYFICHVSAVASSLNLLCLNVDKFIAIIRPLHHNSIITKSRVCITVIISWLLSIIWASFFISTMMSLSQQCGRLQVSFEIYCVFTIVFFILPTLFSAIISFIIGWIASGSSNHVISCQMTVTKVRLRNVARARDYLKVSKRAPSVLSASDLKSKRYRSAINRFRTLIFVFATTAWSFLTCLPYRLLFLFYYNMSEEEQLRHSKLAYALFAITAANPLGNPIITFLTQRRYRKVASSWCGWLSGRGGMAERSGTGMAARFQTWECGRNGTIGSEVVEFGSVSCNNKFSKNEIVSSCSLSQLGWPRSKLV